MFAKALIIVLLAGGVAHAEETVTSDLTTLTAEMPEAKDVRPTRKLEGDFTLELRAREDLRERPENRNEQSVHEISGGGRYEFNEHVATRIEISVEKLDGESTFYVKQGFIDWKPFPDYTRVRLGRQYLPVGLINERDNMYSSNPPFMRRLLTTEQAIDIGAVAQIAPLGNRWVYLEGGVFSGRLVRAEDEREASPERPPTVASLKSESDWHRAFATYFQHDLAFYDPMRAWGGGLELKAPSKWLIRPGILVEHWRMREIQRLGPDQNDRVWLIGGELAWWKLKIGQRWSESRGDIQTVASRTRLPLETSKVYWLEFAIIPEVRLRAERVMETQSEVLRDEWVGRALAEWTIN